MQKKDLSIDLLRILATIGVVSIHSDQITVRLNYFGGLSWWFTNIIHAFTSASVPLFFMISGYLLIRPNNIKNVKKKVISRILVPLLLWIIIYIPWKLKWHGEMITVKQVLFGGYHHLYFLYILSVLYLIKPKLEEFISRKKRNIDILVLLSFMLSILITAFHYLFFNFSPNSNPLLISPTYISYFTLGYWIKRNKVSNKLFVIPAIQFPIIISMISYFSYQKELTGSDSLLILSNGSNYMWESFNPLVVVSSFFIFSTVLSFFKKKSSCIIEGISSLTYGIYLVHPMLIDLADHYLHYAIHLVTNNLWLYYSEKVIIVFIASGAVISILKKIPFGKFLLGE